jgi:hypothetical protein
LRSRGLLFKAGRAAFQDIRRHGFAPDRIGTIAGASGGAKWLVLSQLDRVIVERILPSLKAPAHLIGSSIGAWRLLCYAQDEPRAAIERFEAAYLEQRYSDDPDIDEISAKTRQILDTVLGRHGAWEIVNHPVLRTHVLTARARFLTASEHPSLLGTGLILAATMNVISRRSLGAFFKRSLFYDPRDLPPFYDVRGLPIEQVELSEENLADAVLASGAIPLVINGVRDIHGAPRGTYRDGGIIDYHLDLPTSPDDRYTLYPHFFDQLIPGWFDKKLPWRQHSSANTDRTILICPSAEFLTGLANGKMPDRTDFRTLEPARRRRIWRSVVDSCRALADELNDVLDNNRLPARLEPL